MGCYDKYQIQLSYTEILRQATDSVNATVARNQSPSHSLRALAKRVKTPYKALREMLISNHGQEWYDERFSSQGHSKDVDKDKLKKHCRQKAALGEKRKTEWQDRYAEEQNEKMRKRKALKSFLS